MSPLCYGGKSEVSVVRARQRMKWSYQGKDDGVAGVEWRPRTSSAHLYRMRSHMRGHDPGFPEKSALQRSVRRVSVAAVTANRREIQAIWYRPRDERTITGTGLKKCRPTTLDVLSLPSGSAAVFPSGIVVAAIFVMLMEDVFVARIVFGESSADSVLKMLSLIAKFSAAAWT